MGEDNVVFGSDYPHSDHIFPSVAAVRARQDISEQVKRKMETGGNPFSEEDAGAQERIFESA